jgi:hypothetical protein
MDTKKIYINSYYSEDLEVHDGLYLVEYDSKYDIKKEIEKTYEKLNDSDTGDLVNNLDEVLEELYVHKVVIRKEILSLEHFDCDYGNFKEV